MGSDAMARSIEPRDGARRRLIASVTACIVGLTALAAGSSDAAAASGRGYEMVSPPEKGGANIVRFQAQAAPAGDALLFTSPVAFGDSESAGRLNNFLGRRQQNGWSSNAVNPPLYNRFLPFTGTLRGASGDLGQTVHLSSLELTPDAVEDDALKLYRRDSADGSYDLLTPVSPEGFAAVFYEPRFVAGSADYSHLIYHSNVAQTGDAPADVENLYEWSDGTVRLVNILPDAECAELTLPPGCAAPGGGSAGDPNAFSAPYRNFVSSDGSRIFFAAGGNLYVRENGTESRQLGPDGATFETANPSGNRVLYSVAGSLSRIDVASGSTTPIAANVAGVVDQSDEMDYVYFVSSDELAEGGESGQPNVYLWHEGTIEFVAHLTTGSESGDNLNYTYFAAGTRAATPDGRHLVFYTAYPQAGCDNQNPDCNANSADPEAKGFCTEYYRYSADDGQLECVSCNPSGAPPLGSASTEGREPLFTVNWQNRTQFLSDDGARVFFNSPDPLVAEDTNGVGDVYLWEEAAGPQLISTGRDSQQSVLLSASASGGDAYFWTFERLAGIDRDENADVYDAKVGGGIAAQNPPPPPSPCLGESCKGATAAAPAATAPITSTVQGAGNQKPLRKKQKKNKNKNKKHQQKKQNQKKHGKAGNQGKKGR